MHSLFPVIGDLHVGFQSILLAICLALGLIITLGRGRIGHEINIGSDLPIILSSTF
jgi:hypothetical protein